MTLKKLKYVLIGKDDLARKRATVKTRDGRNLFVYDLGRDYLLYLEGEARTDPPTIWEWVSAQKAQSIINIHTK